MTPHDSTTTSFDAFCADERIYRDPVRAAYGRSRLGDGRAPPRRRASTAGRGGCDPDVSATPHDEPHAAIPPAVAAVLALTVLATVGLNVALHSELVVAGRDGATYTNTAKFLIDDAGLFPEFGGATLRRRGSRVLGTRLRGTRGRNGLATVSPFNFHGVCHRGELFGSRAIFLVNAFIAGIALLVLFGLAMRFMSPSWALLAVGIVAASLPFIYYGRTTFTEMASLVMSAGGAWAGHVALSRRPPAAFAAGLLLGAATLTRVDAWMLGVALALLLVTVRMLGEEGAVAPVRQMLAGFAVTARTGVHRSRIVLRAVSHSSRQADLPARFRHSRSVGGGSDRGAGAVPSHRFSNRSVGSDCRGDSAGIRLLLPGRDPTPAAPIQAPGVYGLEAIQVAEGSAIEPDRSYGELSVWWLVWYLGVPIVLAGLTALTVATRRALRRGATALRFAALLALVPLVAYLIRPSINPDQIWAIRRFLPVAIPAVVIGAVAMAAAAVARVRLQPAGAKARRCHRRGLRSTRRPGLRSVGPPSRSARCRHSVRGSVRGDRRRCGCRRRGLGPRATPVVAARTAAALVVRGQRCGRPTRPRADRRHRDL